VIQYLPVCIAHCMQVEVLEQGSTQHQMLDAGPIVLANADDASLESEEVYIARCDCIFLS
jgi:hypothetical protein